MRITSVLSFVSLLASASVALAEDPDGGVPPADPAMQPEEPVQDPNAPPPESEPYEPGVDPYAQPQPDPSAGAQTVPVVEEESAEVGRGVQYGLHLVVPVYLLNHDGMGLNVGIGAQGRIGWEFGSGLSTELSIGVMYNGAIDGMYDETLDGMPVTVTWEGYGLTTIWIGLGLRYAFLNPSAFVPFVGVGLMLPIWSNTFRNGLGGVSSEGDAVVSFGFNGLVGVQLEVSNQVGIEVGAQLNYAFAPGWDQIYAAPEMWLTPFAGVTLYF